VKRILCACLEQTQKFESEEACQSFVKGLERKRVKFKIVAKKELSDKFVELKIKRDYGGSPTGDYLD